MEANGQVKKQVDLFGDVVSGWENENVDLETISERDAEDEINAMIESVRRQLLSFGGRMIVIKYLRLLWDNESWQSIKNKLDADGSEWYVWFMDGVRHHLVNIKDKDNNVVSVYADLV